MKTVGIYARKSNREDGGKAADRKSCAIQVQECRDFAERKGWQVLDAHVYQDDAKSGAEFVSRPGLKALLDATGGKKLPFTTLLVTERSRLGRDTVRTLALIQALADTGLEMWAVYDAEPIALDGDNDEIREFLKGYAGGQERKKAGVRSRAVKARNAASGRPTGKRLYGYLPDFTIVPAQADTVRKIFKLRAEGMGFFRIARALERDSIPSPRGGKVWNISQVANITRQETYRGVRVWGQTMRQYRRGKLEVVEAPAENIVRAERPDLRLIDETLWKAVQAVNAQAAESTWRNERGWLKSKPTAKAQWLLNPFLSCGVCNGSMHAKQSGKHWRYVCTRRHQHGVNACSNAKGLNVEHADRAILKSFEEGLVGSVIMGQLQEALDESKRRAQDPEPLKAEAAKLKREIANLITAAAGGEVEDIRDAIHARRARLEHLEGTLTGLGVARDFDLIAFAERMMPVVLDWQEHLKKNTGTAQQVLRKILPEKIKATPTEGGWKFSAQVNYSSLLAECGLDAISAIFEEVKLTRSPARRGARRGS
jgi:site-specific DNA recombinase